MDRIHAQWIKKAAQQPARIALPEGDDPRVAQAAGFFEAWGAAEPVVMHGEATGSVRRALTMLAYRGGRWLCRRRNCADRHIRARGSPLPTTWIDADVTIEPDSEVWPDTHLEGRTAVGAGGLAAGCELVSSTMLLELDGGVSAMQQRTGRSLYGLAGVVNDVSRSASAREIATVGVISTLEVQAAKDRLRSAHWTEKS